MIDDLRDGYSDGKFEETARFRDYATCRFLGLDEFDKVHLTGYAEEKVDALIDERYRYGQERGDAQRFTVIAMNDDRLPFESLPSYTLSRLRYGINTAGGFRVIHNTGPGLPPRWIMTIGQRQKSYDRNSFARPQHTALQPRSRRSRAGLGAD